MESDRDIDTAKIPDEQDLDVAEKSGSPICAIFRNWVSDRGFGFCTTSTGEILVHENLVGGQLYKPGQRLVVLVTRDSKGNFKEFEVWTQNEWLYKERSEIKSSFSGSDDDSGTGDCKDSDKNDYCGGSEKCSAAT